MYFIGYDIGSSSVKGSLLNGETGKCIASATSPKVEMKIDAPNVGWAEQHPDLWWENLKLVTSEILSVSKVNAGDIKAIGISYQMHGLVLVDSEMNVLRPAIIWCDGRAAEIGNTAFEEIGEKKCLDHLLNSPGNFTASKLKWVKDNEPELYSKVHKAMLPGDYIAARMSGVINTTASGLSEGVFWDFKSDNVAEFLLQHYGIEKSLLPDIVPTFAEQSALTNVIAEELGLAEGTKITYRAGDQPNNAFSLNVLKAGEVAATAGTSGVVYSIGDGVSYDERSRINTFVHVNHEKDNPSYGNLLCVNGTGILNSWAKANFAPELGYVEMNELAAKAPIGSDGLVFMPFGNGAERLLENKEVGGSIYGAQFNRHSREHIFRGVQEGIVFALNYGFEIMKGIGVNANKVRAGYANMFLSPIFAETFASITETEVELYNTDGSQGAARGAALGYGYYANAEEAFMGLDIIKTISPNSNAMKEYAQAYNQWKAVLKGVLEG